MGHLAMLNPICRKQDELDEMFGYSDLKKKTIKGRAGIDLKNYVYLPNILQARQLFSNFDSDLCHSQCKCSYCDENYALFVQFPLSEQ